MSSRMPQLQKITGQSFGEQQHFCSCSTLTSAALHEQVEFVRVCGYKKAAPNLGLSPLMQICRLFRQKHYCVCRRIRARASCRHLKPSHRGETAQTSSRPSASSTYSVMLYYTVSIKSVVKRVSYIIQIRSLCNVCIYCPILTAYDTLYSKFEYSISILTKLQLQQSCF